MSFSVDFHTHTSASADSLTSAAALVLAARRRKLDRIVVTDHNSIAGALAAQALDPELVIVGEEIMTTRGEILAAFVRHEVPSGLSPQETIHNLREQGAFISVSHPFDSWRSGAWKESDLLEITAFVDAIEIFNARCMIPADNKKAQEFARHHNLSGTAGSDAHAVFEVGAACLVLPEFSNTEELRIAIREGVMKGRLSPFWVHLFSRFASLRKKVV
jgi:predicted metal-dependent phosphoesterase TrpH